MEEEGVFIPLGAVDRFLPVGNRKFPVQNPTGISGHPEFPTTQNNPANRLQQISGGHQRATAKVLSHFSSKIVSQPDIPIQTQTGISGRSEIPIPLNNPAKELPG